MRSWWRFSGRQLWARPARTLLTTTGVSLGVALVLAVAIASQSLAEGLQRQAGAMFGQADVTVQVPPDTLAVLSKEDLERVRSIPGVERVALTYRGLAQYQGRRFPVYGVQPDLAREIQGYDVIEGSWFTGDDAAEILLLQEVARRLNLGVGDPVTIAADGRDVTYRVAGLLSPLGAGSTIAAGGGLVPLAQAQRAFGVDGFTQMSVQLAKGTAPDEVRAKLSAIFPGHQVRDISATVRELRAGLTDMETGLLFLAVVAVLVGAFMIFNTFSVTVAERTRELGILRGLGATRGQVVGVILREALTVGVLGSLVGLLLGVALGRGLLLLTSSFVQGDVSLAVPPGGLITALATGLLATALAALPPALAAASRSPVEAAGRRVESALPGGSGSRWVRLLGLVALVALTFLWVQLSSAEAQVWLGVILLLILAAIVALLPALLWPVSDLWGRLLTRIAGAAGMTASRNLARNRRRSTITIAAVALATAMVLAVGTLSRSISADRVERYQETQRADILLFPAEGYPPLTRELEAEIRKVPGVALTSPNVMVWRRVPGLGDTQVRLNGVRGETHFQVNRLIPARGTTVDMAALESGRAAAIAEKVAERLGLKVGDAFTFNGNDGPVSIPVGAIYQELEQGGYTVMLPMEVFEAAFAPRAMGTYSIKVEPGVSPSEVIARIARQPWGEATQALTAEAMVARIKQVSDQMFAPFQAINLICLLVAVLGIANTLVMAVLEQTREIGVIRSLGAEQGQVRRIVVLQGATIGLLGSLFGVPIGLFLGRLLVAFYQQVETADMALRLPWGLMLGAVAAIAVTAALASLLPARSASRLNLIDSLRYE